MKKTPLSTTTLLIVLLSILTAINNQAFSQPTPKNSYKKNDKDTLISLNSEEQRVWNRLKNSEEYYRSRYFSVKQQNDSLFKQVTIISQSNLSHVELSKLQHEENILLRKENLKLTDQNTFLTEDRDKYKTKAKKRLKAAFLGIPIGVGLGLLIPVLL